MIFFLKLHSVSYRRSCSLLDFLPRPSLSFFSSKLSSHHFFSFVLFSCVFQRTWYHFRLIEIDLIENAYTCCMCSHLKVCTVSAVCRFFSCPRIFAVLFCVCFSLLDFDLLFTSSCYSLAMPVDFARSLSLSPKCPEISIYTISVCVFLFRFSHLMPPKKSPI